MKKAFFAPRTGIISVPAFAFLIFAYTAYLCAFAYGMRSIGTQSASFGFLFVAIVSWFFGTKGGLIAAFVSMLSTSIMIRTLGPEQPLILAQVFVGSASFVLVGLLVGGISNLYSKLKITESLLREEHKKSELILGNIFPRKIVERLKNGETLIADRYLETTILFSDLVGFTDLTHTMSPHDLVKLLDKVITGFDKLSEELHIEKIKTIGDAYLVVSGLPDENTNHAPDMCRMALAMLRVIEDLNRRENINLQIRIGMHSGPVIGGVIGPKKFTFDLWGDTVNLASRLETTGIPGQIQVSQTTYDLVKEQFRFETRSAMEIKGYGTINTYMLQDEVKAG